MVAPLIAAGVVMAAEAAPYVVPAAAAAVTAARSPAGAMMATRAAEMAARVPALAYDAMIIGPRATQVANNLRNSNLTLNARQTAQNCANTATNAANFAREQANIAYGNAKEMLRAAQAMQPKNFTQLDAKNKAIAAAEQAMAAAKTMFE